MHEPGVLLRAQSRGAYKVGLDGLEPTLELTNRGEAGVRVRNQVGMVARKLRQEVREERRLTVLGTNAEHRLVGLGLREVSARLLQDSRYGAQPRAGVFDPVRGEWKGRKARRTVHLGTKLKVDHDIEGWIAGPRTQHAVVEVHGVHLGEDHHVVDSLGNRPARRVDHSETRHESPKPLVLLVHRGGRIVWNTVADLGNAECAELLVQAHEIRVRAAGWTFGGAVARG